MLRHPDATALELSSPNLNISRALIAEDAIALGADVLLWIDADMTFRPEAADELIRQALDLNALVGAVYLEKSFGGRLVVQLPPGLASLSFFDTGSTIEVMGVGFGLAAHPVSMLTAIAEHQGLAPREIKRTGSSTKTVRDWFGTDAVPTELVTDDYAFCARARASGFHVFADTRQRVGHLGEHEFHIEDIRPLSRAKAITLRDPGAS